MGDQSAATTLKRLADLFNVTIDELLAKNNPAPSFVEKDHELMEKVKQLQELGPDDRNLVFRSIETFATQKRMARMLAGHFAEA